MPHEDFDIDALAAYLHLTPDQVRRLADRGKVPGRKVSGEWRFASADIHHWLEDRIGLSDDEELIEMEAVLQRSRTANDWQPRISQLLSLETIEIPLLARTRGKVISAMCEVAARGGLLWDPEKMADAVRQRENLHPTALDNGVALLHPRRPMPTILAEPVLAFGRTHQGIPFGGGTLTDLFFLICSTTDSGHLKALARLSRLLSMPELVDRLRAADDAPTALSIIREAEDQLDA